MSLAGGDQFDGLPLAASTIQAPDNFHVQGRQQANRGRNYICGSVCFSCISSD